MKTRPSALLAAVSICLSSCSLFGGGSSSERSSSETRKATITWVNYDETVLEVDEKVLYGTTPTYDGKTPKKPSDEYRYTFKGWDPEVRPVDGDQTYTAQYEAGDISFTVFIVNTYGSTETLKRGDNKFTVSAITPDLFPFDLTRNLYTFRGWKTYDGNLYYDAEGNLVGTPIVPKDRDAYYFYDDWTPLSYTIEYRNLGDGEHDNPLGYSYGDEVTFTEAKRNGYTFQGWYKDETFTTPIEGIGKKDYGDIIVYAKWEAITYEIYYDLFGGKNSSENPTTYTIENEIVLKDPTKDRFEFDHWEDYEGNTVTGIPAGNTGEKTMRAVWKNMDYREDNFEVADKYIVLGQYPVSYQTAKEYIAAKILPLVPDLPTFEHPGQWTPYLRHPNTKDTHGEWYFDLRNADGTWRGLYTVSKGEAPTSKESIKWFKFTDIRWRILTKSNGKALVEAPALDTTYFEDHDFDYQGSGIDKTTWAYSYMRRFLNVELMREMFTPTEAKRILTTTVDNSLSHHSYLNKTLTSENIEKYGMKFIDTEDKLFLLSMKEMSTYYTTVDYYKCYTGDGSYPARGVKPSYTIDQMAERYDSFEVPGYSGVLTRTPYASNGGIPVLYNTTYRYYKNNADRTKALPYFLVKKTEGDHCVAGIVQYEYSNNIGYGMIRPVMWVNLSA